MLDKPLAQFCAGILADIFRRRAETKQRLLSLNEIDLQVYQYARDQLHAALDSLDPRLLKVEQAQLQGINQLAPANFPVWFRTQSGLRALVDKLHKVIE